MLPSGCSVKFVTHSSVEVMKAMCVGVFITAAKQIHSEDTDGVANEHSGT